MVKDLTTYTQAVFSARGLEAKKAAMFELIEASCAKRDTKVKAHKAVDVMKTPVKIDAFAFNYLASGEGMKVH